MNTERRVPRPAGPCPAPGTRARTSASSSRWPRRSAPAGPTTRRPRTRGTSSPTCRRSGRGFATTGSREVGLQWPCTDRDHPGSPYLHAPSPSRPNGKGKFYLVEYQPPIEQFDLEYPFVLSTGRTLYHYNSATMTMREEGVTQLGGPFVEMHPEDADALGIADGDWVRLVSRRGELEARAKLGDRVYPGLVWMALHFAEAKVNWLTRRRRPAHRHAEYKTSAVRVEPVGGSPGRPAR